MNNKINKDNCLATVRPDLAKEWHPTKNGSLTPEMVLPRSSKKVWWYLPYDDPETGKHFDFEWEAKIDNRSQGRGCPFFAGKAIFVGYNDLASQRPDLAKEWDYKRNFSLKPEQIATKSNKRVWWCIHHFDEKTGQTFEMPWQASVYSRTVNNSNCPYLSNQAVFIGYNDLATTHPELVKQWHPTKNGNLTPYNVTHGNQQKIWWLEHYYSEKHDKVFPFEWAASANNRSRGEGNPFLNGRSVWKGFNDLASNFPELSKEWDYKRNEGLTPDSVTCNSNRKVWWVIKQPNPITGELMELPWKASVDHRTKGLGCPYLSNQSIFVGYNDLETTHPELAKQWHPTRNETLRPSDVCAGSTKKVWWKACVFGKWYEWEAVVSYRAQGLFCIPELKIHSIFELNIAKILTKHGLVFEGEKSFEKCKSDKKYALRYDFYINDLFLIEADGKQHFREIDIFEGRKGFDLRTKNDSRKNIFAIAQNIHLLRIPYIYDNKPEKIESFILEFIETKKVPQEILDFYSQFEFSNYVECVKTHEKMQTEDVA